MKYYILRNEFLLEDKPVLESILLANPHNNNVSTQEQKHKLCISNMLF